MKRNGRVRTGKEWGYRIEGIEEAKMEGQRMGNGRKGKGGEGPH